MSDRRPGLEGPDTAAGRRLDAALHLLDRQLLDVRGRPVGKVDDLELTPAENPDEPPTVTAVLVGPSALAPRLGRLGRGLAALLVAIRGHADPARISAGVLREVGDHVGLSVTAEELGHQAGEDWVRDHVIGHLPGAGHAPE